MMWICACGRGARAGGLCIVRRLRYGITSRYRWVGITLVCARGWRRWKCAGCARFGPRLSRPIRSTILRPRWSQGGNGSLPFPRVCQGLRLGRQTLLPQADKNRTWSSCREREDSLFHSRKVGLVESRGPHSVFPANVFGRAGAGARGKRGRRSPPVTAPCRGPAWATRKLL